VSPVCALCSSPESVATVAVSPRPDGAALCGVCRPQVEGGELDVNHWYCLQESAWSEEPAVQVVAWRLLGRLSEHSWAADLRDQLYLDDDTRAWADHVVETGPVVTDSNGTVLADGDFVTLIKDLPVKGANFTAKRGTLVRGIRLGDDPTHVEGKVNKVAIFLKTEFLKKA